MRKSNILKLALGLILVAGIVYLSYRIFRVYKRNKNLRERVGAEMTCEGSSLRSFVRGRWKGVLVDNDVSYTDGAHNIIPCDIDQNRKVDLIANAYRSDALILYKYELDPVKPSSWTRYVIDSNVGGGNPRGKGIYFFKSFIEDKFLGGFTSGAHYTSLADVNKDGREDLILAGDYKNYDVVLYEAPESITDTTAWKKHVIYRNDSHRTYFVETGDIDGDDNIDMVIVTKTDNSIGWLKNNGTFTKWPITWIDKNCDRCFNARVADLNKDGKMDIVASEDDSPNGGILHLYVYSENPEEKQNWSDIILEHFPKGEGVSIFEIIDIDLDGNLDIVAANHQGGIYILENPYPENVLKKWNRFIVTEINQASRHDFREIDVGDIDCDGDMDIVVADEGQNLICLFINEEQTFHENWREYVVDQSDRYLRWCHSVDFEDIDQDGDLDIAVAAAASNVFLVYLNQMFQ